MASADQAGTVSLSNYLSVHLYLDQSINQSNFYLSDYLSGYI